MLWIKQNIASYHSCKCCQKYRKLYWW